MNRRKKSEIAELMAVRSKFSENGEFQPEWKPPVRLSFIGLFCMEIFGSSTQEIFLLQAIEAPKEPAAVVPAPEVPQIKPAWRVVSPQRPERKARTHPKAIAAAPNPAPAVQEAPKAEVPAWAQWRRT